MSPEPTRPRAFHAPTPHDQLSHWITRPPEARALRLADLIAGSAVYPTRVVHAPFVRPTRDAGLLLPVFDEGDGLQIVLTQRGADVRNPGDIAFPGGTCEPDERASAAALREAWEETGVEPADVEVLMSLSTRPTATGFMIWPYIGVLAGRPETRPRVGEVDSVFTVAATDLVADAAWERRPWQRADGPLLDFFTIGERLAWGTTGDLLKELLEICIVGHQQRHADTEEQPR